MQLSSKQCWFFHALTTWVHDRGIHPLQPPVRLPAARSAQRVKDWAYFDLRYDAEVIIIIIIIIIINSLFFVDKFT